MAQEVSVKRTKLSAPTLEDTERKIIQVQYQAGELPPHFIYIPEKDWTPELEKAKIKEDIKKRLEATREIITL